MSHSKLGTVPDLQSGTGFNFHTWVYSYEARKWEKKKYYSLGMAVTIMEDDKHFVTMLLEDCSAIITVVMSNKEDANKLACGIMNDFTEEWPP
jgi:hypothetical protein